MVAILWAPNAIPAARADRHLDQRCRVHKNNPPINPSPNGSSLARTVVNWTWLGQMASANAARTATRAPNHSSTSAIVIQAMATNSAKMDRREAAPCTGQSFRPIVHAPT